MEIGKVRVRAGLHARREPYWGPALRRGQYLGIRKIDDETFTWIARLRDEAGHQHYRSLGHLGATMDVEAAQAAALEWFKSREAGVLDAPLTLSQLCAEYVTDREHGKGNATARDAEARFERTIYGTVLGDTLAERLRTPHYRRWLDGLNLGKASANRTLTTLKAALNLAVSNRRLPADRRIEWELVKPHKNASVRRSLYLDLKQRRALLANCQGAIRNLIEAAMLTGSRAGELISAECRQFDSRIRSMAFAGKTGPRTVPLAPAAVVLFKRLAKGKAPSDRLLVRDDGKPWAHSDWDELVREAADAAKLPAGTCLYTLRHSFITAALTSGMSVLEVARLVGTSVAMIDKHYGHLATKSAADKLKGVDFT